MIKHAELARLQRWAEQMVEAQAQRVIAEPWPEPDEAGVGVFKDEPPRVRIEVLEPARRAARAGRTAAAAARARRGRSTSRAAPCSTR